VCVLGYIVFTLFDPVGVLSLDAPTQVITAKRQRHEKVIERSTLRGGGGAVHRKANFHYIHSKHRMTISCFLCFSAFLLDWFITKLQHPFFRHYCRFKGSQYIVLCLLVSKQKTEPLSIYDSAIFCRALRMDWRMSSLRTHGRIVVIYIFISPWSYIQHSRWRGYQSVTGRVQFPGYCEILYHYKQKQRMYGGDIDDREQNMLAYRKRRKRYSQYLMNFLRHVSGRSAGKFTKL
jgi:hypothetical protein